MIKKGVLLGAVLLFLLTFQSAFVVQQATQVLVLELGRLVRVIKEPGLFWKVPFIQETFVYDKRILGITLAPTEMTLNDQKRAVVDMFVRYPIIDPLKFYQTVRSELGAQQRLISLVSGISRSILGGRTLANLLSEKRIVIMNQIRDRLNQATAPLGIQIVDVRILRADLPPANSLAIFNRMISERQKEALEIRAVGEEKSRIIRSEARLQGDLIIAKATTHVGDIRAEGERKAQDIYRTAYGRDPEFAHFYQTLEACRQALHKDTLYVLTPDHSLLHLFEQQSASHSSKTRG